MNIGLNVKRLAVCLAGVVDRVRAAESRNLPSSSRKAARAQAAVLTLVVLMAVGAVASGPGSGDGLIQRLNALVARVAALEAGGASPRILSVGTTNPRLGSGPHPYSFNRVEFNTAADCLAVVDLVVPVFVDPDLLIEDAGIAVLREGYYRINFRSELFVASPLYTSLHRNGIVVDQVVYDNVPINRVIKLEVGDLIDLYTVEGGVSGPNFENNLFQIQYLGN